MWSEPILAASWPNRCALTYLAPTVPPPVPSALGMRRCNSLLADSSLHRFVHGPGGGALAVDRIDFMFMIADRGSLSRGTADKAMRKAPQWNCRQLLRQLAEYRESITLWYLPTALGVLLSHYTLAYEHYFGLSVSELNK